MMLVDKIPDFQSCCFCCSLRTGVVVICTLDIVVSSFFLAIFTVALSVNWQQENVIERPYPVIKITGYNIEPTEMIPTPLKTSLARTHPSIVYGLYVYLVLNAGVNICYLIGIKMEKDLLMIPNIIFRLVRIVLYTIANLIGLFIAHPSPNEVIGWVIDDTLAAYFLLVLLSYYKKVALGLQPCTMIMTQCGPHILPMMPNTWPNRPSMTETSLILSKQQVQQNQYQSVVPYGRHHQMMAPTAHQDPPPYEEAYCQKTGFTEQ